MSICNGLPSKTKHHPKDLQSYPIFLLCDYTRRKFKVFCDHRTEARDAARRRRKKSSGGTKPQMAHDYDGSYGMLSIYQPTSKQNIKIQLYI